MAELKHSNWAISAAFAYLITFIVLEVVETILFIIAYVMLHYLNINPNWLASADYETVQFFGFEQFLGIYFIIITGIAIVVFILIIVFLKKKQGKSS